MAKLSRLMPPDPPQSIAPRRLAEAGAEIAGEMELDKMPRLKDLLHEDQGSARWRLAFTRDEQGVIRITGEYQTSLPLVCQRCLEPFILKTANPINVGVVFDRGEIDRLPEALEPLLLKEETILLAEFIEEEILLGLPISPVHEQNCVAGENEKYRYTRKKYTQETYTRKNPFSVLKNL